MESQKNPLENGKAPVFWPDNSMDCKSHGAVKSLTRLNDYNFHFQSEKKIHFSIISLIGIDCRHPKNGKKWRKKKTKCYQVGEGETGSV